MNKNRVLRFFFSFIFVVALSSCTLGNGLCQGDGCTTAAPGVSGADAVSNPDGSVTVTITGTGFENGMTVTVSGIPCTNVTLISSTQLTCILPNGSIALVNIILTTPSGGTSSSSPSSPLISTSAVTVSQASGVGNTVWSNITSALTNDGAWATVESSSGSYSKDLRLKGYFSTAFYTLPSTAVINGIRANCYWRRHSGSHKYAYEKTFKILRAGVSTGTNYATNNFDLPSSFTLSHDFGGASDLWGTTLTPADVNGSDFGLEIVVEMDSDRGADIDYCQMAAYFH